MAISRQVSFSFFYDVGFYDIGSGDLKTMLFENAIFLVWTEKTMLSENGDVIKNHSFVSIQNGGQRLPCGFNFAPVSPFDILKCACVDFIWACAQRV